MKLPRFYLCIFILLVSVNQPVKALAGSNIFSKSVQSGGTVYDIISRPVAGSSVQIVTVSLKRGGKKVATLKADLDQLPYSAEAVDLAGDGTTELVLISRAKDETASDVLDICWLDGTNFLHRSSMPELDEKTGYRGGERYHIEDNLIVRSIPIYLDNDLTGKPTGGIRLMKYKFKDGTFTLYIEAERSNSPDSAPKVTVLTPNEVTSEKKMSLPVSSALSITEVMADETGIEVRVNRAIPKFRTMRLDKPERIAIDIPGADSYLAGRKITINSFGITKARVGRNKGFLRVVLDTNLKTFPRFEVKSTEKGLKIEFLK